MPDSWVQVANSALTKLGDSLIVSFDDDSPRAALVKERYQPARDHVLRMHPWNCAMKRVSSANLSSPAPAFDYTYYHSLPDDWLRTIFIGPDGTDYRIEGRYIATDATELEHRYIRRVSDPTEIDTLCGEAIAFYLAWDICTRLQQNGEIKQEMWNGFQAMLRTAKTVDAQEEPTKELRANEWLDSRWGDAGFSRAHNSG